MSETNFTKLFSSITASTIWSETAPTKVVWITMLAMSDAAGFVYASIPGLAKISGVSMDETIKALDLLLSPDEWSRDKDNEGRRIEEIDGGWAILNHPKYRKRRDAEERRAYHREYMRNKRASVKSGVKNVKECEPQSTQEEGEAEEDIKTNSIPKEINPISWAEFEQHRKEMKKPLSQMARTKAMNVIKDLPFDEQAKVIDRTIQSRWAGLFINGKNEENKRVNESSHARVMQRLSDEIANE